MVFVSFFVQRYSVELDKRSRSVEKIRLKICEYE